MKKKTETKTKTTKNQTNKKEQNKIKRSQNVGFQTCFLLPFTAALWNYDVIV